MFQFTRNKPAIRLGRILWYDVIEPSTSAAFCEVIIE